MDTLEQAASIPADLKVELQKALNDLSKGIRPSKEESKKAAAEMDLMREENRKRFGEVNIAVDLIRHGRDSK